MAKSTCSFILLSCLLLCNADLPQEIINRDKYMTNANHKFLHQRPVTEPHQEAPKTPPLGTSTFHLARLATSEIHVAEKLTRISRTLLDVHKAIERYLTSWKELSEAGAEMPGWVEHPLHAYALTKHVSLGWPALEEAAARLKDLSSDCDILLTRRNSSGVATEEDLTTVAGGIARLHDVYSFNLTAFYEAHIKSSLSLQPSVGAVRPTIWDFYRIGSEAARIDIWSSGVDFLREALNQHNATLATSVTSSCSSSLHCHPFDVMEDITHIPKAFQKVSKMHDQVLERKGSRSRGHSTHKKPLDKKLARKKKYHKEDIIMVNGTVGTHTQGQMQYVRLCKGEDLRTTSVKTKLYCQYVNHGSAYYLIGPLRMEVQSLSPYVVTLEGVVTSAEAKDLQQVSATLLEQSSTIRVNGLKEVSYQRTSSTAWLSDHESVYLPILTTRIESLTGLNAKEYVGAESYQVVNYGVGGHYTVHHDAIGHFQSPVNRIATFLIYLTDVPQGGSTVFPWLGVAVQPKRGRALLWYNLDRNGLRDDRLEHAACPVLLGDKWGNCIQLNLTPFRHQP